MSAIEMSPCPFCGGPPKPHYRLRGDDGKPVSPFADVPSNGATCEAYVFCHECGAQSPKIEDFVFETADIVAMERRAVQQWNDRDTRHLHLYLAGVRDGQHEFPRFDDPREPREACEHLRRDDSFRHPEWEYCRDCGLPFPVARVEAKS